MAATLLAVRDLKTHFRSLEGVVPAVDGVSLTLDRGETLGVVGESGCGKSMTALSIMRLVPGPQGRIVGGEILFEGEDLVAKPEPEMRAIRGNSISMVFQEPMTSLDPVFTIGDQIIEAVALHQGLKRAEARRRAVELLGMVGIPSPGKRIDDYPHQLSGGMRQRAMIAMALSCRPKLLIADEPTTALDVTIQAQILDLMLRLQQELGMAILLITHDLGVVAEIVQKAVVMYAGKVVESSETDTIFADPRHPYTQGLLGSIPKLNEERERLQVIEGSVPNPFEMPAGCRFYPRCNRALAICESREPDLAEVAPGHLARCWLWGRQTGGPSES